jgi:uncharacterized protein with HEPN domain
MKTEIAEIKVIYDAVRKILKFTEGIKSAKELKKHTMAWDAVKMNLVVIYETYLKLGNDVKEKFDSIPWHEIEVYKPRIENQFIGFDADEIWKVIQGRMPEFKGQLKEIVKN